MALNIGQINFGVSANTAGLRKAVADISRFQKQTDALAKSQVKGAMAVAKGREASSRQLTKNLREVVALRKEMLKAKAPVEQIAKVTNAYRKLVRAVTTGKTPVHQLGRAFDQFGVSMGRSRAGLARFNKTVKDGAKPTGKYAILLRDMESSAVLALGPLSGLGARIRSIGAIIGRGGGGLTGTMFKFILAAAAAAAAVGALGIAAVRAGEEMKGLQLRFQAATGSAALGAMEFKFVIGIANKLGLRMDILAKSYTRFLAASQGTRLEGQKARDVFENIARGAAALKLSGADLEGVMRAVEQIMSKGTVQAEELRGQLGDRLPGAFRIASEAIGKTTAELNKMLKAGEIISEDFIPAFAKAVGEGLGKTAELNVNTLSGSVNILSNNWKLLLADVNAWSKASVVATSFTNQLGFAMGALAGEQDFLTKELQKGAGVFRGVFDAGKFAPLEVSSGFEKVQLKVKESISELITMENILRRVGRTGDSIEKVTDFFKVLPQLAGKPQADLLILSEIMGQILNKEVAATASAVANAWTLINERARAAGEALKAIGTQADALKKVDDIMRELEFRAAALREGPDQAKIYSDITSKANEYAKILALTNKSEEERAEALEIYIARLTEIDALETKHKNATKDANKDAKDQARSWQRQAAAIAKAVEAMETMRLKTAALARGPDSLELFDKVEEPIRRMTAALHAAGVPTEAIQALMKQHREVLMQSLALTDRWARAHQQMADAIVNGLEDIILKGESVKDMLHNLANELLRVAIRALFLDKLKATLFSIFSGGVAPSVIPLPGGGGRPNKGSGDFASGGSFKLSGSGGSDKIPFFGFGKAGETVSVSRGDQMMRGGGVNITQINNFEGGGISDPATLIPILEENNRKLKAEILDGFDRGSFA